MRIIKVKVKAGVKEESIRKVSGIVDYEVYVKEKPEKGRANEAVRKVIANFFRCSVKDVSIVRGEKSKIKIIRVNL